MSHIHLPDGLLPFSWWIAGYIVCLAILGFILPRVKGDEIRKRVPFVGVIAALMLITMSVPLGIIPIHLSLAVLCGILAGPSLGFIAVFVVNIILSLLGHGGITVVGINTLILGSEVVIGYYLFKALSKTANGTIAAMISNTAALIVSTSLMLGVLGATAGLITALPGSHQHEHSDEIHIEETHDHGELEDLSQAVKSYRYLMFSGWGAITAVLIAGIFIESLVTGMLVRFFSRVRPDLISHGFGTTNG